VDIPSERSNRKAISATPGPPGATHSLTEGDLITGAQNRSAIGTLVDRTSRYVTLVHLPGGHSADELHLAMKQVITTLPAHAWLTLTWDQGSEMANHHHIATGFPEGIFFADPGSPWQRGSNENTVPAPPILPEGQRPLSPRSPPPQRRGTATKQPPTQGPELADTDPGLRRCSTLVTLPCCDDH